MPRDSLPELSTRYSSLSTFFCLFTSSPSPFTDFSLCLCLLPRAFSLSIPHFPFAERLLPLAWFIFLFDNSAVFAINVVIFIPHSEICSPRCRYGAAGIPQYINWGCSSVGRALEWHSRGRQFDPDQLHQNSKGFGGCNAKPFFYPNCNYTSIHILYVAISLGIFIIPGILSS